MKTSRLIAVMLLLLLVVLVLLQMTLPVWELLKHLDGKWDVTLNWKHVFELILELT